MYIGKKSKNKKEKIKLKSELIENYNKFMSDINIQD